jgi:catalase
MDSQTAERLAGSEPDYHVKDLFNKIEKGECPTWILSVQVMKPEEVQDAPIDIFDCTLTWPHDKYPLRTVGRLTLNENARNHDWSEERTTADNTIATQLLPGHRTSRLLTIKHGTRHRSFCRHGYAASPS